MRLLTITDIAELTGSTWRTVRQRLTAAGIEPAQRSRKSALYDSTDALPAVLIGGPVVDRDYDLTAERARLAAAQAERVEHDNALRRGELVTKADAVRFWTDQIGSTRARLLRLPSDCARDVPVELRGQVQAVVRAGVHEALHELAEADPGQ